MTARDFIRLHPLCAYCKKARSEHRDHVVAKAMRGRHHIADNDERYHVGACRDCNERKFTYRLYPVGFDRSLLPGKPDSWKEWSGQPISEMYPK